MPPSVRIQIEIPADLAQFQLPDGVQERLHLLLDKQDSGQFLTDTEQREPKGLAHFADLLSLLRLRTERPSGIGE